MRLAANGTLHHFVVVHGALPASQVTTVEQAGETFFVTVLQQQVRFLRRDFSYEQIAPTNLTAVRLQLDRSGGHEWPLGVPIVFQHRIVDHQFAIQVNGRARADLTDEEPIPFAKRLVGQYQRILTWVVGRIVPKPTGSFVGADRELFLLGVIPDLHLRRTAQIDAAVSLRYGLVFDNQLDVAVIFLGGQKRAEPIIDQFTVFDTPVLEGVLGVGRFLFGAILRAHCSQHIRAFGLHAIPTGEVLAIKEGRESGRWLIDRFVFGRELAHSKASQQ